MPRRIDPEKDKLILADTGLGMLNKDVAKKYGVSPSYVSKLTSGKKKLEFAMPDINTIIRDDLELYGDDVDDLLLAIADKRVFLTKVDPENYVDGLIQSTLVRLKMYIELKKKIKEK